MSMDSFSVANGLERRRAACMIATHEKARAIRYSRGLTPLRDVAAGRLRSSPMPRYPATDLCENANIPNMRRNRDKPRQRSRPDKNRGDRRPKRDEGRESSPEYSERG